MRLKVRIYLEDNKKNSFMGVGVLWLLQGIEKTGSIRQAASDMNMSYTKAHQILKNLEETIGQTVLERHRGGNNRSGAELSPFGKKFLQKYIFFNDHIEEYASAEFINFLKDMEIDGKGFYNK